MSALVSVLTAGAVSSGDAQTLLDRCQRGPALEVLRQPTILRALLQAIFDPSRPPKPAPRENLLRVLARVGAAVPGADEDGDVKMSSAGEPEHGERVLSALREAQSICERNEVSEVGSSVTALQRCAEEQVAACGVLLWARAVLTQPQHSGARYNTAFLPPVLKLIMTIARRHPMLQGEVCSLLNGCLTHEPPADSDTNALTTVSLRRQILDALLLLMNGGCVFPVLAVLEEWLTNADLSLVRHVLQQLLGLITPPYSEAFARRILRMLRLARTQEAHRGSESKRPLVTFAQQVAAMPGLGAPAREILEMLQPGPGEVGEAKGKGVKREAEVKREA